MNDLAIERNIATYFGDGKPTGRFAAFDYCFNYFQLHREENRSEDLLRGAATQLSCLHLGFYLASWGMLRGRAMRERSVKAYVPVVEALVSAPHELWTLDVDRYDKSAIAEILGFAEKLGPTLREGASITLVSKVLLGTRGCVPAFDRTFNSPFHSWSFGRRPLCRVAEFYQQHADLIDAHTEHTTPDFETGSPTARRYTRAKVIDMVFSVQGGGF